MRYKRCLSLILALGMATTCMPMGMGLSEEAIVPVIEVMEEHSRQRSKSKNRL